MKIGFVIYGDPDRITGGNMYDCRILEALRESGHSVRIHSLPQRQYYANLTTNFFAMAKRGFFSDPPDVLLQDELVHPSLFLLNRFYRKVTGVPVVAIVHNLTLLSAEQPRFPELQRQIETAYLNSLDGFIAVSARTRSQTENHVPHSVPSITAYPGGDRFGVAIDEQEILSRARNDTLLQVLFLGNVTPNKQLETLLTSLGTLPTGLAHLTVVGRTDFDPGYTAICRKVIQDYSPGKQVRFTGAISDSGRVAEHIRASDIVVLPSRTEGFPLVIPEAAGFGVPAIVTTESAADEFIDHRVNGFLVKPGDSDGIAELLGILHGDREYLAEMSVAALMRHRSHPSWRETGRTVADFLHTLVEEQQ